jgi:hypothetical protein
MMALAVDNEPFHDAPEPAALPVSFRRKLLSFRTKVRIAGSNARSFGVTIYRPFQTDSSTWYCSYRIVLGNTIVAEESGPGADELSAVYLCYVMLSRRLKRVQREMNISFEGHEFWWIRDIVPDAKS